MGVAYDTTLEYHAALNVFVNIELCSFFVEGEKLLFRLVQFMLQVGYHIGEHFILLVDLGGSNSLQIHLDPILDHLCTLREPHGAQGFFNL